MSEKYKQINLFDFGEEFGFLEEKKESNEKDFGFWGDWRSELDFKDRKYYFGSIATDEYIFSVGRKGTDKRYLCFQTNGTIIMIENEIEDENDLLKGKEKVGFPALFVGFFDENGKEKTDIHYADDDSDDRQKWIIGTWHMDEVSTNRIEPSKKPHLFCEIEFALPDYIKWLENDIKTRNYTR